MLDLEGFREINETLGHQHGDQVLEVVARRLAVTVPSSDLVARLAGDEFAVLMTGLAPTSSEGDASARLALLQEALVRELVLGGIPLAVEASFGLAMASQPRRGPERRRARTRADLLRHADIALHHAKLVRRPVIRYEPALDTFDPAKLGLLAELRRGIEAGQLVLHYQPKLGLADGVVRSVEALVRWARPDGTLLMPADFLDAAESTGLIEPLTDWVLDAALGQMSAWGEALADVSVAVNVSARNLAQPDFADSVLRALAAAGVPASRLVLEITETALLADPDTAKAALTLLDAAGVAVSIDDFGHGHTALGYLAQLPVRELKIDRELRRRHGRRRGAHRHRPVGDRARAQPRTARRGRGGQRPGVDGAARRPRLRRRPGVADRAGRTRRRARRLAGHAAPIGKPQRAERCRIARRRDAGVRLTAVSPVDVELPAEASSAAAARAAVRSLLVGSAGPGVPQTGPAGARPGAAADQ